VEKFEISNQNCALHVAENRGIYNTLCGGITLLFASTHTQQQFQLKFRLFRLLKPREVSVSAA